jgi:hypothetical protein
MFVRKRICALVQVMVIKKMNSKRGDVLIALTIKYLPHVLLVVPLSYCNPKFSSVALYLPQNRVVVWNNNKNNNTDLFVFLTYMYKTKIISS